MPSISGSVARMGVKVASTWGTAVACGVGNKFVAEASWAGNATELVGRSIGSGLVMPQQATIGNIVPTVSLVGDFGFNNNWPVVFAALFGSTTGSPAETTVGQADYKHTLTLNPAINAKYLTFAYESTTTTVHEFPTCAVRSIGLRTTSVPGYLEASAELLAGLFQPSSAINTNATLANTTLLDSELAAARFTDDFWIDDASTAALASGDQYNITGFDFALNRPQDIIPEIKGAAGNSEPTASDIADGTFNVTVKSLVDHTFYNAWIAETVKKGLVAIEGTQIGTGVNKSVKLYLPNLKLITEPQYAFTSPGMNPLSLNFKVLAAASNPTGMTSLYPYMEIVNGLSTSLLA